MNPDEKPYEKKEDRTTVQILKLSLPVIAINFFEPMVAITDTAIIGGIDAKATQALAATGLGVTLLNSIFWFFGNIRAASVSLISKAWGEKRLDKIGGLLSLIFFSCFFITLFLALLGFATLPLLRFYVPDEDVRQLVVTYLIYRLPGLPFILTASVAFGIFYGTQKPNLASGIIFSGGCINLILSFLWVRVFHQGDTPLDSIADLALGSLVGELFIFFVCGYVLLQKSTFRFQRISREDFPEFFAFGRMFFHLVIRSICIIFVFQFCTFLAAKMGAAETAVQGILLNLFLTSAFLIDGVSSAALMTSGKFFAEKDHRGLLAMNRKVLHLSIGSAIFVVLVFSLLYFSLIRFFSEDPAVHSVFYSVFWLLILLQPAGAMTYSYDSLFKGMGKTKELRNSLIIASLVAFPACFLLAWFWMGFEMRTLWVAFFGWIAFRSYLNHRLFKKTFNL